MKFTCDDCGAQYMIADEKIGPKGVKVRCKKCANVIILRPQRANGSLPAPGPSSVSVPPAESAGVLPAFSLPSTPASAQPAAAAKKLPPTPPDRGLSSISGDDEDEATQAFEQRPRAGATDPAPSLGVSSDLGLSTEFAAKGFDAPVERNESPFSAAHLGGSARDLARAERDPSETNPLSGPVGLGMVPRVDESSGEVNTSVDSAPKVADDFGEVETRVGPVEIPPEARRSDEDSLEGSISRSLNALADDEEETGKRQLANLPPPARLGSGFGDEGSERTSRERGVTMPVPEDSDLGDALRDELESDRGRPASSGRAPMPMAADGLERAASSPARAPMTSGARKSLSPDVATAVNGNLEEEIGSAFEAVFGNGAGLLDGNGADPFEALVGAAERSLGENGHGKGDDEKKATRVFDTDAMQKLQEEQDLASRVTTNVAEKAVEEWYVAVNDNQVGPMTVAGVEERYKKGEVDSNSLCWKQGMADWIAIRFVKELESIVTSGDGPDTKVARVEKPDLSLEPPTRAHVIAAKPKERSASTLAQAKPAPAAAKPLAEVPGDPPESTEPSEPSWRPSAASALASLAQAELASSPAPVVKEQKPHAISLPPPPAGQKLPFEPISASMFGAGEQTYTRSGTSLPKAPDLASSVSLREPGSTRDRANWLLPVLIAFGSVTAVGGIAAALYFALRPAPQPAVVQPPPQLAMRESPAPVPTQAPVATAAPVATPTPGAADPAASAAPGASAAPAASAAPSPSASAAPVASAAPSPTPALAPHEHDAAKTKRPPREAAAPRERPKKEEDPGTVVAAAPPKKERVDAEDLLAEGSKGKAPKAAAAPAEDALPEQLEDGEVLRVIRAHKADIKACIEKQAKDDPNLDGVMTVNIVILKNGSTSQNAVSPDKFKGTIVGKCVLGSVKGWVFPKFTGRPMPIDFPVVVRGRG
ncbi:MAG: AgmX/PglI C-terminal domain-containing protein [Myxococcota bacterium]